jgi:LPXTG-site transpeptidase (sortase) family protein
MGNTIIAGHVDNGLGLPAVFRHLSEIQKGSVIEVETHNGTVLRFEVTGVESLLYAESSQKIFVGTEAPQLVLVTCDGTWLPDEKTYNRRLVVYAKLLP